MSLLKEIESKPIEYTALIGILVAGFIGFIWFKHDPSHQRNVVIATGGAYFLWSLYHHYKRGDLHLSIIVEYLVFILLGVIILSSSFLF